MTISLGFTAVFRGGKLSRPRPRRPNCYWPERATSLSSGLSKAAVDLVAGLSSRPSRAEVRGDRTTPCHGVSLDQTRSPYRCRRQLAPTRCGSVELITHLRCAAGPLIRIKTKGISHPGLVRQLNAPSARLSLFARRNCDDDLNATDQANRQGLAQQCSPATSPLGFLPSVVNRWLSGLS